MLRRATAALFIAGMTILFATLPGTAGGSETSHVRGQLCLMPEDSDRIDSLLVRYGVSIIKADPEEDLFLVTCPPDLDPLEFAALLALDPEVDIAEPNYRIEMPEAIRQMVMGAIGGGWDDYEDQEMTARIGLDAAHVVSRGAGIVVAVLDTGIDPAHPAFAGRLVENGYDAVENDAEPWETANGVDEDRDGAIDEGFEHGTMVAGIVALVAPDARIMPVRVLDDEGRGTTFDIARGMIHAATHGADLLNLSFGAPQWVKIIERRLRISEVHDVISVAGAGNRGLEEPAYYPGYDERAIMVTAVDTLDIKADFADFHAAVDLSAPGVGIRSAWPGAEWGLGSGCSFSVPIVTAGLALVLSRETIYDRELAGQWLALGVEAIDGLPGNEPYQGKLGAGRIDLPRLLGAPASSPQSPAPGLVRGDVRLDVRPNPSTGGVTLILRAPAPEIVRVAGDATTRILIVDAAGRLVRTLSDPSAVSWSWDGLDAQGRPVPAGAYYARWGAPSAERATPVVIIR